MTDLYGDSVLRLRPYQLMCVICSWGDATPVAPRIRAIRAAVRAQPDRPIALCGNVGGIFAYQDPGPGEDTGEGAEFNCRRDMEILVRMDLGPGSVLPARILFKRLVAAIRSPEGICAFRATASEAWRGCPKARSGSYEKGWEKGLESILPPRDGPTMEADKAQSIKDMQAAGAIRIRPHILACAVAQYGNGVRPPFQEDNLPEFLQHVLQHPDTPVTLVPGADWMMCGPCPTRVPAASDCCGGRQGSQGLYNTLKDLNVLQVTGWTYGVTLPARVIFKALFDSMDDVTGVCALNRSIPALSVWRDGCGGAPSPCPGYRQGRNLLMKAFGFTPPVEVEEDLYSYVSADNGAGPMWCHGSTCLARSGDRVFASGLETIAGAKPLHNCRWMLFERGETGWRTLMTDPAGRTREPCPIAVFPGDRLFLSANPTLVTDPDAYGGPARPEIFEFSAADPSAPPRVLRPAWDGEPPFTEHSYRSFAADGANRELILFQNIGHTHCEWAFLDRNGTWAATGKLVVPWGAEYETPEPVRVCYPNVALRNRAAYFCGVSDIIEPNKAWRAFKKELTGKDWDYDFRRLFYTWTPDITAQPFRPWIEIASREATAGWITPGDLWVASDGAVHLLWTERALDERLRDKFFPGERQSHALQYAVLRDGRVAERRTLCLAEEGDGRDVPGGGRFQVTPDDRLFVFFWVAGKNAKGEAVTENRLVEIRARDRMAAPVTVPLQHPFTSVFTATGRGGSRPSATLDLLGIRTGSPNTIGYARIRIA